MMGLLFDCEHNLLWIVSACATDCARINCVNGACQILDARIPCSTNLTLPPTICFHLIIVSLKCWSGLPAALLVVYLLALCWYIAISLWNIFLKNHVKLALSASWKWRLEIEVRKKTSRPARAIMPGKLSSAAQGWTQGGCYCEWRFPLMVHMFLLGKLQAMRPAQGC